MTLTTQRSSPAALSKARPADVVYVDDGTWFYTLDAVNTWHGAGALGIGDKLFEIPAGEFYLQLSFCNERFAAKQVSHERALRWLLQNNHQPPPSLADLAERCRIRGSEGTS